MAKPNTSNHSDSLDRQSIIILIVLAACLFAGYIWLAGGGAPQVSDNKAVPEDSKTDDAEKPGEDESKVVDRNQAARLAREAAMRGEVSESAVEESDDKFVYVVGSGESYTGLARRSVAAINNELSPAERIAAETKLTQDAGAQYLDAGQEVIISKKDVEVAIKWAQNLSDEHKAAWKPYADLVDWE